MKAGVFTNLHKDKDLSVTKALLSCLDKRGVSYCLESDLKQYFDGKEYFSLNKPLDVDFMITVFINPMRLNTSRSRFLIYIF